MRFIALLALVASLGVSVGVPVFHGVTLLPVQSGANEGLSEYDGASRSQLLRPSSARDIGAGRSHTQSPARGLM